MLARQNTVLQWIVTQKQDTHTPKKLQTRQHFIHQAYSVHGQATKLKLHVHICFGVSISDITFLVTLYFALLISAALPFICTLCKAASMLVKRWVVLYSFFF